MVIEFYGEISDYTRRRADKLKKRYYAVWLAAAALALGAAALVSGLTGGRFIVFLVFAVLLAGVAAFFYFGPLKKNFGGAPLKCRVTLEGDELIWEQYTPQKTIRKVKKFDRAKRVVKTDYCYYIVFNDIGNAVICERCLLKKGTFDLLEKIFEGKIKIKKG